MGISTKSIKFNRSGATSEVKSQTSMQSQERFYRKWTTSIQLVQFHVAVKETDLQIFADKELAEIARDTVLMHRSYLESFINFHPGFKEALIPWPESEPVPLIVSKMIAAGQKAGVGPMAAVAGALAEIVGLELLNHSSQVIVENGGDVFVKTNQPVTIGIYASDSPFSGRVAIKITEDKMPTSICTSSANIGHSLSFGRADAACIVADSGAVADAAATAVGNMVKTPGDIQAGIDFARSLADVKGGVIIVDRKIGAWGELEVVPLTGKKG